MFRDDFDPIKSDTNKAKHGIDFLQAREIWLDPAVRTVEARMVDGESRYATIGLIGENLWVAIWADVGSRSVSESVSGHEPMIRIISAHRAEGTKFERYYHDPS